MAKSMVCMMQPRLHTSQLKLYGLSCITSGAIKPGVPILKLVFSVRLISIFALPRSPILILAFSVKSDMKMF